VTASVIDQTVALLDALAGYLELNPDILPHHGVCVVDSLYDTEVRSVSRRGGSGQRRRTTPKRSFALMVTRRSESLARSRGCHV
jgi:hypothetical protein